MGHQCEDYDSRNFISPEEEAKLYRNITEDSANGVAVIGCEKRNAIYINSAAIQYFGLKSLSESMRNSLADALQEQNLSMFLNEEEIASLREDEYSIFYVERRGNYYSIRGKRLKWSGQDAYILYITDETTEHQKELELEKLLNQIPTGISTYIIDEKGVYQSFMNQGFYHTFGVTKEEYARYEGYNTFDPVNKEDRAEITKILEKMRAGQNSCDFVYRSVLPGHETSWIRLVGKVAERKGQNFTLYAGFTDVTAQIQSQTRQRELFDTIPSGILEFFFDGKYAHVISANQTLIDMIGYDEEAFAAKTEWNLKEVVNSEDYHLLTEARNSIEIGKGKTYDFRLYNKKTGVFRWISCDYTITEKTALGVRVISAFLDIDDKRKAESESAAKSRFLSRMSHEIRTPINAIMGIAELERQDIENNHMELANMEQYMKETLSASEYLLTLVNDILDTSRIENNKIEIQEKSVQVEQYLKDIHTLIEPLVKEKKIHFHYERITHLHETYIGDGVRVKQIIVNLLNNAIKFTPEGGHVSMTCEALSETEDKTMLKFVITDDGIGMSEEFQKKMFTPFVQENSDTTSPFAGSGLGLSISRSLAQRMGGDITCRSKKGEGTTFTATVMVKRPAFEDNSTVEENGESTDMEPVSFEGTRILVCEDHPLNQKITRALLERRKCMVEIAEDGAAGVEMFERSPAGYYSVILMDIRMPNMDGLQATKEIRSLSRADSKTIPIVAMSANAYDEDVQKSIAAGMNAHLAKPVNADMLYRTIAKYRIM